MDIEITARHFVASQKLKEFIHKKIKKVEKFQSDIMSCHIILAKENNRENVEIITRVKGYDFVAHENAEIFERSLTSAIDKIFIQLKKQHEKSIRR